MARVVAVLVLGAFALSMQAFATAKPASRSCQVLNYTIVDAYPGMGHARVIYRVYFANNGAVQMYSLVHSSQNAEADHAALLTMQKRYGLEFVNSPPLQIISYKKKSSTFSIPEKAVDSCGRITYFH
ncbi:MAG: hypothetical protein GIW97_04065 [Candidatus Eremiobacteraeota bacterium]|nr:hypothetical protein [Candidatus Eremiobacteraeota bacterium]